MKNLKRQNTYKFSKKLFISLVTFGLLIGVLLIGMHKFNQIYTEQNLILTEQAIRKAVVQCYAVEGRYPADITYLEDNYNLSIDYDKYNIFYECVASNLMPEFAVFE